jgi:uncharacterized protein (DUF58 family)
MPIGAQRPQVTSLLTNAALDRLERLRINASRRFTNRSRGEHLAGKGGASIEFADYRDYVAGDDIRFVDWNIFARLNRPYMKLYHMEEEMHIVVLVDASSSMRFEHKLDRAKSLAAAFCVMALLGDERLSVYVCNGADQMLGRLSPCTGRANMLRAFRFIEAIEAGGDAPVELAMENMLKLHTGRGAAVLLSDFLTFGQVDRALNLVFSSGLEPFGLQILGPGEIDPDISGDLRLVDCETGTTLDVTSAYDLLSLYQDYRLSYEGQLATLCRQRSGRFAAVSSEAPVEWMLFDLLRRRGWVQ